MLNWLTGLPSAAVYVVLGLFAALENVIPPLPTDAAVALGAFLSHRGVTTPIVVFLVIWICNIAGATAVYFVSRRYGRQLFATRAGRRLLAPRSLALIEREYLRFGVVGIFIARFLPGFRAVVAPFAGLAGISAARALIPMGLASALWYGAITALGTALGAEWSAVETVLLRVNRSLAVIGGIAIVGLVAWLVIRRRRRARQPVWSALHGAFETTPGRIPGQDEEAGRAAAVLLLEIAYADSTLMPEERELVGTRLRARWDLPRIRPSRPMGEAHPEGAHLEGYRARIEQRFGPERRIALVERIWQVALDGAPRPADSDLVRRAATLLGLSADEINAARERAAGEGRA